MDYKELHFGPSSELSLLALDDQLRLVAVASKDGLIRLYSQVLEKIQTFNVGAVLQLQFINGKGCLVAFSDGMNINILVVEDLEGSFHWKNTIFEFNVGSNVSQVHVCQHLARTVTSTASIPLLVADDKNGLEMMLIYNSDIYHSHRVILQVSSDLSSNKIIRIEEMGYKDGNLIAIILWNDHVEVVRFSCRLVYQENTLSIYFNFDQTIYSSGNNEMFTNFSVISPNSFVVSTSNGEYGIMKYTDEDHGRMMIEELVFPYGPFPCKTIDKCIMSYLPKIKEECFIFCGGLPEVTYKDLHSLSVAVKDEPEICFTFSDPIIDFDVFHQKDIGGVFRLEEIIVITQCQCISIVHDNGIWKSFNNCHFSPMTMSKILAVSNVIERDSLCDVYKNGHISDYVELLDFPSRFFATFHADNFITVWDLCGDKYSKHSEIDIDLFFSEFNSQVSDKLVLWPIFQKCGLWNKKNNQKNLTIDSLKILGNDNESFYLTFIINGYVIFYFKILFKHQKEKIKSLNIKDFHKHILVKVNDDETQYIKEYKINEEVIGIPFNFTLVYLVTLNDNIDLSNLYITGDMVAFGGPDGVGLLDIMSDKYFYISSEDLTAVESGKTKGLLTELIQMRLRKRKSFESSKLKNCSELKSSKLNTKIKSLKITSFYLLKDGEKKYDLTIGFNNGLLMILLFTSECNGDINISSTYRRLPSNVKESIVFLSVLTDVNDTKRHSSKSRVKFSFEENKSINRSIDSTKEGSLSTDSKSTHLSSENCQITSEVCVTNSKSKTMSLKWPSISSKIILNDFLLIKCDSISIKILDYLKLKTRFKYKINEQFKISDETNEKFRKRTIVKVDILETNGCHMKCLVVLTNDNIVTKLCLPDLIPIESGYISENIQEMSFLSINKDVIIIGQNTSFNNKSFSEITVLDERKKITTSDQRCKKFSIYHGERNEFSLLKSENDKEEMDFMRCAEPSLNSLLW